MEKGEEVENAQEAVEGDGSEAVEARVADSIKAAVSMSGISESALQFYKAKGSPGFRGGRVYLDEVEKFVEANDFTEELKALDEMDFLKLETARENLKKAKFEREQREGKWVDLDKAVIVFKAIGSTQRNSLRRIFEENLPVRSEGKTQMQIRKLNAGGVDEVCEIFSSGIKKWIRQSKN